MLPKTRSVRTTVLFLSIAAAIAAAGLIGLAVAHARVSEKPDYWPTQGWQTSTPEEQGMDSGKLAAMFDKLPGQITHSVLIVRNGRIVTEAYGRDYGQDVLQNIYSCTKSVISALFGIADKQDQSIGTESLLGDYFPQLRQDSDPRHAEIQMKQLLTMTPGITWSNDDEQSSQQMMASPNWVQYMLGLPLHAAPGTEFVYSNGNPVLVGAILGQVYKKDIEQVAKEKLFQPLGITNYTWEKDPQGNSIGAWGLHLTARDMAKFGYLYLNNGVWDSKNLVPKSWVEESTQQYVGENLKDGRQRGYGYFWWLRNQGDSPSPSKQPEEMFSAVGYGGQRIVVIPKENMVVVFTAMNEDDSFYADKLIDDYILPSVVSAKPLPPNPQAQQTLQKKIDAFHAQ